MGKKLVIVESPAKAKTISRFLGSDYVVEASFGHVRDLPESAKDVPAELKKTEMGRYGVDVNDGFKPYYVVPAEKARHVAALRKAAKDVEAVLLATDEDREGESISWHVLELLKPKKSVKVERIVFHEITPEAIREAI
ncbi:MAG: DNA topoisomerase I, partial [Fimbriimonadaceae bacterium]|nr:DNA topoisomerase I [Fimbriimonadaceae bacterium]